MTNTSMWFICVFFFLSTMQFWPGATYILEKNTALLLVVVVVFNALVNLPACEY